MSRADRERWDRRYREGRHGNRDHPSAWLAAWLPELPPPSGTPPRAVDVACGTGRNALALDRAGYRTIAVDVSPEGLLRARQRDPLGRVAWVAADLDRGLPLRTAFGAIVQVRYHDPTLLRSLPRCLAPGGWLLAEVHLRGGPADVVGPGDRFRAAPGEIAAALAPGACGVALETLDASEGGVTDPDGRRAWLARALVRRPLRDP